MLLIKDLGSITQESRKKDGTIYLRTVHKGIFECPNCHKQYERDWQSGKLAKVCNECKGLSAQTHGMSKTRPYHVWQAMLQRCNNPNNKKYHLYGGKGVQVCQKWNTWNGFWEDNKDRYKVGTSIDRIDPEGDYCLENTRWISISENSARVQHQTKCVKRFPLIKVGINTYKVSDVPDAIYDSIAAAERDMGDKHSHISDVTLGKRKSAFGYYWEAANMVIERPLFTESKEKRKINQWEKVEISPEYPDGLKLVGTWESAYVAAKAVPNAQNNLITAVCKGRRKSHAGYVWTYAD